MMPAHPPSGVQLARTAPVPASIAAVLADPRPSFLDVDRAIEESLAVWLAAMNSGNEGIDYQIRTTARGRKLVELVIHDEYKYVPRGEGDDVVEAAHDFLSALWADIAAVADEACPPTERAATA